MFLRLLILAAFCMLSALSENLSSLDFSTDEMVGEFGEEDAELIEIDMFINQYVESVKFMTVKAMEEGVIATPSGLLYKTIHEGEGPSPNIDTKCSCHYIGHLVGGIEFDNTYKKDAPLKFSPKDVAGPWQEVMLLMKEGGITEFYMPPEMGYGDEGLPGIIPPGAALIYRLHIGKVHTDEIEIIEEDVQDNTELGSNEEL